MTYFSKIPHSSVTPSPTEQAPSRERPVAAPPPSTPDWRDLASAMLAELARAPRADWAFIEHMQQRAKGESPDLPPLAGEAGAASQTADDAEDQDDADAILDRLEAELDGAAASSTPLPDPWQARTSTYRPRAAVLCAVIRLARTFGSVEAFAASMAEPGRVTALCTHTPQLSKLMVKLLTRLISESDAWVATPADSFVASAAEVVRASGEAAGQIFASVSDSLRGALEKGSPIVVIAAEAGTLPAPIKALAPRIVVLAQMDREMLLTLLVHAYPDAQIDESMLSDIPADAVLSRLDADNLTLALRARDPATAIRDIAARIAPVTSDGPGLAEFPLPLAVRQPVEQLVADLRAWRSGEIPWRDVARGLLLVGPPGSGKTEIPRLIAKEAGITVVAGSISHWSAEGSRASDMVRSMRNAFASAAAQAPALLFVDEVDSFGDRARPQDHNSSWTDYVVTALLDMLDGFHGHEGVVVMGATNHLGKIDAAIRRPGRFDTTVTLGYPDHELMPQALRWQLGGDLPGADLSAVAIAAIGMSGAEIAAMVRAARARARADRRALTIEDLSETIASIRPPLAEDLHWRVALHEAGHAIVGTATGRTRSTSLAIVATGGFTAQALQTGAGDRQELEALLAISLAGRAAEALVLGSQSMGSGGPDGSDLAHATGIASAMEASYGLGDSPVWLGPPEAAASRVRLDPVLRSRVDAHLRQAEAEATRILKVNRPLLEEMATVLMARKFVSGADLEALTAKVVLTDRSSVSGPIANDQKAKTAEIDTSGTKDVAPRAGDLRGNPVTKEPDGPA